MVGCIKVVGRAEQEDASARIHAAAHAAWNGGGGGGSSAVLNSHYADDGDGGANADARGVAGLPSVCGVIGICTKRYGALSRVLNASLEHTRVLSFMATKAAPGQISQDEILAPKALSLVTVADRRFYCLFGSPISKSPSPDAQHRLPKTWFTAPLWSR